MPSYPGVPQPTRSLWCKFGEHPFSEDEDWKVISMTGPNDITVSWTACPKHIPNSPKQLTTATVEDEER